MNNNKNFIQHLIVTGTKMLSLENNKEDLLQGEAKYLNWSELNKSNINITLDEIENKANYVCGCFKIKKCMCNYDTYQRTVTLEYYDKNINSWREFKTNFFEVSYQNISKTLQENGIEVLPKYYQSLSEYLQQMISNAENNGHSVSQAGFNKDLSSFYLNKKINSDLTEEEILHDERFCEFLIPTGNRLAYDQMLRNHVTNIEMQLALAIGATAPISSYFKKDFNTGNLIVGLKGTSTTGKSTALTLMSSLFADPSYNQTKGFARTGFSTFLALSESVKDIYGIPVVVDDISAFHSSLNGIEDFIMSLECGESKGRIDKNLEIKATGSWSGLIAMNSEQSLIDYSLAKQGAIVRFINFEDVHWTTSAHQSNEIKSVCSKNYGFYGDKIVKFLYANDKNKQIAKIKQIQKVMLDKLKDYKDEYTERIISKLSLIAYGAYVLKQILKDIVDINVEKITALLIKLERNHYVSRNINRGSYLALEEFVVKNKNMFIIKGNDTTYGIVRGQEIGLIECTRYTTRVFMTKDAFDSFFKNTEYFSNQKSIVGAWKKNKLLITDSISSGNSRNTIRKTINGKVLPTYCFDLLNYNLDDNLSDENDNVKIEE